MPDKGDTELGIGGNVTGSTLVQGDHTHINETHHHHHPPAPPPNFRWLIVAGALMPLFGVALLVWQATRPPPCEDMQHCGFDALAATQNLDEANSLFRMIQRTCAQNSTCFQKAQSHFQSIAMPHISDLVEKAATHRKAHECELRRLVLDRADMLDVDTYSEQLIAGEKRQSCSDPTPPVPVEQRPPVPVAQIEPSIETKPKHTSRLSKSSPPQHETSKPALPESCRPYEKETAARDESASAEQFLTLGDRHKRDALRSACLAFRENQPRAASLLLEAACAMKDTELAAEVTKGREAKLRTVIQICGDTHKMVWEEDGSFTRH